MTKEVKTDVVDGEKRIIVENHPNHGSYEIQTKIGDEEVETQKVLCLENWFNDDYLENQIDKGNLVAALRCGNRGVCEIKVNTKAMEVKSINRYGSSIISGNWSQSIEKTNFDKNFSVNQTNESSGVVFRMTGKTFEDLKVESTVVWKPSKSEPSL